MEDYRTIKYTNCHLGFLKCENCAFKGICKEHFNYQCMANHQSEYILLYGIDDKNYHFALCEKDEFEKLDEKDKAGFISYLTDLYNFLYIHNVDYASNSVIIQTIEKKLESIDDWAECLKMSLDHKYGNIDSDDVIPIDQIQRLVKEIKELENKKDFAL